jgi:hypothetical protein
MRLLRTLRPAWRVGGGQSYGHGRCSENSIANGSSGRMPRGSPTSDSGERYTHERSLSTSVACFLRSLARWRSAGPLAPEQCLFSGCSASACEASESGGGAVSWDRVGLPAAQDIAVDTPESCDDSGIGSNAGNVSPLTSRAQHIHDAIHQVAHIDLGSTAAASRRRDLDHSASVRPLG